MTCRENLSDFMFYALVYFFLDTPSILQSPPLLLLNSYCLFIFTWIVVEIYYEVIRSKPGGSSGDWYQLRRRRHIFDWDHIGSFAKKPLSHFGSLFEKKNRNPFIISMFGPPTIFYEPINTLQVQVLKVIFLQHHIGVRPLVLAHYQTRFPSNNHNACSGRVRCYYLEHSILVPKIVEKLTAKHQSTTSIGWLQGSNDDDDGGVVINRIYIQS